MVKTYQALLHEGAEALLNYSDTPRLDCEVFLAHIVKKERVWLAVHLKEETDKNTEDAYSALIERRKMGEPVAYIIGSREFMGLNFSVREGVLIPRPDTETLVEAVMEMPLPKGVRIIDLCTGSGAIAISLAHYIKGSEVLAVDFSDICVKTARKNAETNGVAERTQVIKADIMTDFFDGDKFDVLVSNPPYIKTDVLDSLMTDVRDFEPTSALDGGDDGLIFYRRIAQLLPALLKKGGFLALEVGHDQAEDVAKILIGAGCTEIDFRTDLAGIRRVFVGRY
jgi:release factor glutamine methyltransferase